MDLVEPHWRTNSSFSPPPPSRIWDCRLQTDGLLNRPGTSTQGTSVSSNSKGSRSMLHNDRYTKHHHSVSDGMLTYSVSPADNGQAPRWASPYQKFNMDSFSTPSIRGSRSETTWLPCSSEGRHVGVASAASCSYESPLSLPESGPWDSSRKNPSQVLPSRNFPNRRSFKSKSVYPLMIHNPVSDCETTADADTSSISRSTLGKDVILSSNWLENSTSTEPKFQVITEHQKVDTSPDPSTSSRRDGFRWSSASSFDMVFDGEHFDASENMDLEIQRSPNYQGDDKKCGVCRKLLWQKSPWGSSRIMRGGDLPIAGILPCSHVFHAECLEQVTPKPQIHEPPCPMCVKTLGPSEDSSPVSQPLLMALRSVRMRRGVMINDSAENSNVDEIFNYMKDSTRKFSSSARTKPDGAESLMQSQFRKHLSLKGKMAKDFFSRKVFRRTRSSSSSKEAVEFQISPN